MKLTRRQEEFVENLVDLNHEVAGPIHYSVLAERLGVSPFTAYDMLCVLEEKGMVTSEYHLAAGKSGPGRAERLFCPVTSLSEKRREMVRRSGAADLDGTQLKNFLKDKLRRGELPDQGVAEELLARIPPDGPSEIRYCIEVMTVVALRLRRRAGQITLMAFLPQLLISDGAAKQTNLTLLGGFAFGLLVQEELPDHEWSRMLLEHVQQFQRLVINMSQERCAVLADALVTVFSPFAKRADFEPLFA